MRMTRLACQILLWACLTTGPVVRAGSNLGALKRAVVAQHARLVHANYQDARQAAEMMQEAVGKFLAAPSPGRLAAARTAWLAARVPYLQTEVCRFYDGPIDAVETFINAWPVDENYIDYVVDQPSSGIIQATNEHPRLSEELLLSLNEKEGEKNICTGFHAIEFLLWGQDMDANGPGNRPWQDYLLPAGEGDGVIARRREFLRLVTRLLVGHLRQVEREWAPGQPDNYRAQLLALDPGEALARVLKGMGTLSGPELSGERLSVAYETKEQEDEHSCFSDNTHNDFIYDAIGLQNVYLGTYVRTSGETISGPGIHDLLLLVDAKLAEKIKVQSAACLAASRAIPAPFDQAMRGPDTTAGRKAIRELITAARLESDLIAKAGAVLGLRLRF